MTRSRLALFALCTVLGAASFARASTLPNGNTLWQFTGFGYSMDIETYPGSATGTMKLTNQATGLFAFGTLYPAAVVDRPHGQVDEYLCDGFFQAHNVFPVLGLGEIPVNSNPYQAQVHISLGDLDGVAFDGALPGFSGQFLVPANQPPLSVFELNELVLTYYALVPPTGYQLFTQTGVVAAAPEPALALFALPLLALLAARRRA